MEGENQPERNTGSFGIGSANRTTGSATDSLSAEAGLRLSCKQNWVTVSGPGRVRPVLAAGLARLARPPRGTGRP